MSAATFLDNSGRLLNSSISTKILSGLCFSWKYEKEPNRSIFTDFISQDEDGLDEIPDFVGGGV